ncbi:MAG TPA: hypothetical protein VFN19_10265 [Candidatus Nanopelagicales bacterium]|nr:hypothetical protein [Candidatus Nanopelagicales bacterium]
MAELIARASSDTVVVRSPEAGVLAGALSGGGAGVGIARTGPETLEVSGLTAAQVGDRARHLGIALHGLAPHRASLEEAFMEMTRDEVEFHAATPTTPSLRSAS